MNPQSTCDTLVDQDSIRVENLGRHNERKTGMCARCWQEVKFRQFELPG